MSTEPAQRLQRVSLGLSAVTLTVVAATALLLLLGPVYLLPGFVSLFEGMNLQLPLPTKVSLGIAKSFRGPVGAVTVLTFVALVVGAVVAFAIRMARQARQDPVAAVETQVWVLAALVVLGLGSLFLAFTAVVWPLLHLVTALG